MSIGDSILKVLRTHRRGRTFVQLRQQFGADTLVALRTLRKDSLIFYDVKKRTWKAAKVEHSKEEKVSEEEALARRSRFRVIVGGKA